MKKFKLWNGEKMYDVTNIDYAKNIITAVRIENAELIITMFSMHDKDNEILESLGIADKKSDEVFEDDILLNIATGQFFVITKDNYEWYTTKYKRGERTEKLHINEVDWKNCLIIGNMATHHEIIEGVRNDKI